MGTYLDYCYRPAESNGSFLDELPEVAMVSGCRADVMQAAAPATPEPEEEKPKEKPKDPLAALPPSKMVLDSWKRLYSNTPAAKFEEVCVNGLWNGADIPNSPTQEVRTRLPFPSRLCGRHSASGCSLVSEVHGSKWSEEPALL